MTRDRRAVSAFLIVLAIILISSPQLLSKNIVFAESGINIISSFAGHNKESDDSILPDPQIAAGPNHLVQTVNYHVDIWTKQGNLVSSTPLNSLFSASNSDHLYNSRIIFDLDSGRFFAVAADSTNKAVRLAVSSSSDPTESWYTYTFSIAPQCPDLPRIGASNDKVVISVDAYERLFANGCDGGDTHGSQFFIIDKSNLVSGSSSPALQEITPNPTQLGVEPAQMLSSSDALYMVENYGSRIALYTVTGMVPSATISSIDLSIEFALFPPSATQPGGSIRTNDYQVQDAAWYKGKLWLAFNEGCIPIGGTLQHACIRLVQINTGTSSVAQDFSYRPVDGTHFFYPALSIDNSGNMIFVYGYSSSSTYPSLAVSGQRSGDPSETLLPAQTLKLGSASDTTGRYGDYFGAAVDPSSSSVVWVTGQYVSSEFGSSVKWSTHIGAIGIDTTGQPFPAPPPPSGCSGGTTCKLTVTTEDMHGITINGYWTVLSQNGATVATGFSPATFTLNNGQQYSVAVADYGQYVFDHWKDTGSKVRDRPISITADTSITAVYRNINEPPPSQPDFSISASPSSLQVTAGGSSATSTITVSSLSGFNSQVSLSVSPSIQGVSAVLSPTTVTPPSGSSASSTLTISASSSAAPGTYQLTVTGASSSLSHSTTIALTISSTAPPPSNPKLTVNTQDVFCNTISGYYTVLFQNGNVVKTGFSPAQFTLNNGEQYVVQVQDYGSFAFDHWKDTSSTTRNRPISLTSDAAITAIYKNLNNPSATGPCSASSASNPDFSISANPASVTVQQGSSATSTITVNSLDGFSSSVSLSASPVSGVTAAFNPNTVTPSSNSQAQSVLTISADSSAAPGTYQLTVTGNSGSLSHSTTISITIPQQQPPSSSTTITVKTVNSAGSEIFGYYTTLWQNGQLIKSAFSPTEFTVQSGTTYQVAVADYGQYVFDHWSDDSTNRFHNAQAGDSLTAIYRFQ